MVVDNKKLVATATDKANLKITLERQTEDVTVNDIFYVPNITANLLSVNKITHKNNTVIFSKNKGCIKNKENETNANIPKILELIHSDLCGPMENITFGGSRYTLTFIDDYTKKVFVYLLKEKGQVIMKFAEFKAMVENDTGRKIKNLRTDNKREYETENNNTAKREGSNKPDERKNKEIFSEEEVTEGSENTSHRDEANSDLSEQIIEEEEKSQGEDISVEDDHTTNMGPGEQQQTTLRHISNNDPCTANEALKSNNSSHWKRAMKDELETLKRKKSWTIVNMPKKGYKIQNGYLSSRKTNQVRYLFALVARNNWFIDRVDVNAAYLNGDLDEDMLKIKYKNDHLKIVLLFLRLTLCWYYCIQWMKIGNWQQNIYELEASIILSVVFPDTECPEEYKNYLSLAEDMSELFGDVETWKCSEEDKNDLGLAEDISELNGDVET
ncbi:uncharacterized protein [Prorops nasuta]|uniref:uncharacterized protein n=1 Tax=Prorops nasuta TaxID=863751 RepID=UPI0034CE7640